MDNTFIKVFNRIGDSLSKFGVVVVEVYYPRPQNKYAFPMYNQIAYAKVGVGETWDILYKRLHDRLNKVSFEDNELVRWVNIVFNEKEHKTEIRICLDRKEIVHE